MSDADQLPEELAQLYAAERAAPVVDAAIRATARARLDATIAHVPLGTAAGAGAAGGLGAGGKALAVLAITVAAGTGTVALVRGDEVPPARTAPTVTAAAAGPEEHEERAEPAVPSPAAPLRAAPSPAAQPEPPAASDPPRAHATPALPRPSRSQVTPAAPQPAPTLLPSQAQLLRRAWALVSSGQAAEALALVRDDQRLHPDGPLAEERDALLVHALARLQRSDEARAAAAAFIVEYPDSIHRARVERAVEEEP